jgi:antitoxin component HigA of HigAB toxin-antitoxin module
MKLQSIKTEADYRAALEEIESLRRPIRPRANA